jgi:antirestriction protein ArdC
MDTSDFAKRLAQRLIEQLEAGTVPWQQDWAPGRDSGLGAGARTGVGPSGKGGEVVTRVGGEDPAFTRWGSVLSSFD